MSRAMSRLLTIAAMFALALPSLAAAEEPHKSSGKPGPKPAVVKPAVMPHGPPGGPKGPPPGPHGPVAGPHGGPLMFRGHEVHRAHLAPYVYPPGYAYRRWGVGMALPALFLVPAYFYADWATLGLVAPEPGFQWVRYGPDLLLVNVTTGQVVDVVYGVFY